MPATRTTTPACARLRTSMVADAKATRPCLFHERPSLLAGHVLACWPCLLSVMLLPVGPASACCRPCPDCCRSCLAQPLPLPTVGHALPLPLCPCRPQEAHKLWLGGTILGLGAAVAYHLCMLQVGHGLQPHSLWITPAAAVSYHLPSLHAAGWPRPYSCSNHYGESLQLQANHLCVLQFFPPELAPACSECGQQVHPPPVAAPSLELLPLSF